HRPAVPAGDRIRGHRRPRHRRGRRPLLRDRQRSRAFGERSRACQMVAGFARVPTPADGKAELASVTTAHKLHLRTLGHASAVLYRDGEDPLLATDPWLVGSIYWRSWWLQNYPTAEEIDWPAQSVSIYVTHEHPDHFHTPTIRRLGRAPAYLFPALPER